MRKDKTQLSKPYEARIFKGGKPKSLGTFATAEEAALAYARADKGKKIAAGKPLGISGGANSGGGGAAANDLRSRHHERLQGCNTTRI